MRKEDWEKYSDEAKARLILNERTPTIDQVEYGPKIQFLDPEGKLTKEERAKVVAMGDRTAISYENLISQVVAERNKPPVEVEGETVSATAAFFLRYALSARSSKEISHSSILEQLNPGSAEIGGDSSIAVEGISVLAALRDICPLRHFGFEALSSRGAVFPDGYFQVPPELEAAGIGQELDGINRDVYKGYLNLTVRLVEHYLRAMPQKQGEKLWEYRWRILSYALDDSRQVTNNMFLSRFSMHPNSALALREGIVHLASSELPETRMVADELRSLGKTGLPDLMKYTEAAEFTAGIPRKRRQMLKELNLSSDPGMFGHGYRSHFLDLETNSDVDRVFLAAFLASGSNLTVSEINDRLGRLKNKEIEEMVAKVFEGFGGHDKAPKELETVSIMANFLTSVGAIYDVSRHRLATHIVGRFAPVHGYVIPKAVKEIGMVKEYRDLINLSVKGFELIANLGEEYEDVFGPYALTRAHLIPHSIRISGADVFHLIRLRGNLSGDPKSHPDVAGSLGDFGRSLQQEKTVFSFLR